MTGSCLPFCLRRRQFKSQPSKLSKEVEIKKEDEKKSLPKANSSSRGGKLGTNFLLFTELRKNLTTFRAIFDMPQLDGSIPIHELVISTAEDLHRMYPDFVTKAVTDNVDARNIHQGLVCFYQVLKCIGDSEWIGNPNVRDNFKYDNVEQATLEDLVKIEVAILEHINKAAKAKFESYEEKEEGKKGESPKSISIDVPSVGQSPDWKYPPPCSSPQTPTSVLSNSPYREDGKCSPLWGLKLQPTEKQLSPMDWKRISFHMILQNKGQNPNKEDQSDEQGGIKCLGHMVDEKNQIGGVDEVKENESTTMQTPIIPKVESCDVKIGDSNDEFKIGEVSPGHVQDQSQSQLAIDAKIGDLSPGGTQVQSPDTNGVIEPGDDVLPRQAQILSHHVSNDLKPEHLSPTRAEFQPQDGVESQDSNPPVSLPNVPPIKTTHSPQKQSQGISPRTPPKDEPPISPPPPPNSPCSSPKTSNPKVAPPQSPSSPPNSPNSSPRTTSPKIAPPTSPPLPASPPNSPNPQSPSRPSTGARPPPPPPFPGGGPPPPPGRGLPPPPPPPGSGNGNEGAPPPPPRSLRAKMTKLKRSTQMANLYRFLKGKVEGSSVPNKSAQAKKTTNNGGTGGGQSMADALAEMTKRSSYFQQIEEDIEKHGEEIKEVQTALSSFQTKDMEELLRFHQEVESKLEILTDETQTLSRFEGFPVKKLEALRMAAALYTKLSGILTELNNWKIESPLEQLLDKVEKYFTKVKGDLEPLERTKDEEAKKLQAHNIHFDFQIMLKIKESIVDVSSSCMELALKEKREAKEAANEEAWSKSGGQKKICAKMLWRAFQFAFKVYSFAGGQDERADNLTRELAQEIEKDPVHV